LDALYRTDEWWLDYTTLSDDGGDKLGRSDIESWIPYVNAVGSNADTIEVRHFFRRTLLDLDLLT